MAKFRNLITTILEVEIRSAFTSVEYSNWGIVFHKKLDDTVKAMSISLHDLQKNS